MARTNDVWETGVGGTYIQTIAPAGYDILINGTNKYLNFNTVVGSSGYGIRDNNGTMEFKNSGGSWTGFGSGSGGVTSVSGTTNGIAVSPTTGDVIVDISASYVGQSSITTLGTIGTGVWNGTIITGTYGGTGVNNGAKTFTYLKNMSFTAADDTGVYTLPTGTKTLVSTDASNIAFTGGSAVGLSEIGLANNGFIRTSKSAGNTALITAWDVDGASATTFITLTANNTPTCDLSTAVTMGGNTIAYNTSSPTFAGLTLSGMTTGRGVYTGASGVLTSSSNFTFDGINMVVSNAPATFTLESTATSAPTSTLRYLNNVNGTTIGTLAYVGRDSSNANTTYGRINGYIVSNTASAQKGGLAFLVGDGSGSVNEQMRLGSVGLGVKTLAEATAYLHLGAGTATASTAPLKFNSGTSLTSAEAGAVEFTTDDLFFTITTGAARKRLLMADPVGGLTSGRVPYVTTNGRLTDSANLTWNGADFIITGSSSFDIYVGDSNFAGMGSGSGKAFSIYSNNTGSQKFYMLTTGSIGLGTSSPTASLHLVQVAVTTGSPSAFIIAGAAHTTLTASTEATDINFNLARTVQFATGAITTQRAMILQAPTYGFVGSSTITNAITLDISGAPIAGTNATLTKTDAVRISGGTSNAASVNALRLTSAASYSGSYYLITNSSGTDLGGIYGDGGSGALLSMRNGATNVVDFGSAGSAFFRVYTSNAQVRICTGAILSFGTTGEGVTGTVGIHSPSAGIITINNATTSGLGKLRSLVLDAGTASANTAPLKFTSGTNLTSAEAGAVEFDGTDIFYTTSSPTRRTIANLDATQTFSNKTLTSPTIQTNPIFAAGTTLKLTIPTGAGATGNITNEFNSGYSSTAVGDLMYLDSSGTWQKADADLSTAAEAGMLGIALSVAASGAAVTVALAGSFVFATAWNLATVGAPIYMSTTAGAITLTAPTTTDSATRIIGWVIASGNGTTKIWFCPSPDYITHT